jgi:hypothetical protein
MMISFPIIVFTSQLVIAVAENVPELNIERECRVDSASAFDPNAGLKATIKRCVGDEQQAKIQLQTHWPKYPNSDRATCIHMAVGDKSDLNSDPPSYVELLTCLEDQQLARKLPKD